jgi:uncharacterized protein YcbX
MSKVIEIGEVEENNLYGFKGMQGSEVEEIGLRSISVVGDRIAALTDLKAKVAPTSVDTIKFPGLLRYKASYYNPNNPEESELIIKASDGEEYGVDDPLLLKRLSEESGKSLGILKLGRGLYHSMPVSVMTLGTMDEMSKLVGENVDKRRFRENIFIKTKDGTPYEEDSWLGKILIFGEDPYAKESVKLLAVKKDKRCGTVNMHPETAVTDLRILKTIIGTRKENFLGIYCAILSEGRIKKGTPVHIASILDEA